MGFPCGSVVKKKSNTEDEGDVPAPCILKKKKLSFLSGGSMVKNPPASAGNVGSFLGFGRSLVGNDN